MTLDSALLPSEDKELSRDIKIVLAWTPQTFENNHQACVEHAKNIRGAYEIAADGSNAKKLLKKAVIHMEGIIKALRSARSSPAR